MTTSGLPLIPRASSLARQAYDSILQGIRNGVLVHGQLYSEKELAQTMGISRTPVREALIELAREGLVDIVPQRGFGLRELGHEEQKEVFELRGALEGYVVERLALTATPRDVERLRDVLDRQAHYQDDPAVFLSIDEDFHMLMPRLVGLTRTAEMLSSLRGAMWLIGYAALDLPERSPTVLAEHHAVVDAIAAGDPKAAVAAIHRHIDVTAEAAANRTID